MNIWFEDYQEYIFTIADHDPFSITSINNAVPCWMHEYESQMERERRNQAFKNRQILYNIYEGKTMATTRSRRARRALLQGGSMTITEIIAGIEQVQYAPSRSQDVVEICRLSKWLALHVQQLELDMRKVKGLQ